MPKSKFLQIRVDPEDRERLRRAAVSEFLAPSTWARQAILQALERWEDDQAGSRGHLSAKPESSDAPVIRRVAEPKPKPSAKRPKRPKRSM